MSSDSDEDELLQEQATGKNPSEQPPKPNPKSASSRGAAGSATPNRKSYNAVQQKQRKGVEEDEDDSDLEILSISSVYEDQSASKDQRKGASSKRRGASRGGGKDDDELWQGGEPDCWKRVDEDENRKMQGKNFGHNSAIFQNHRIRGLLEKCSLDHEARMENLQNKMRERALSDIKWKQIQQDLNHSSDIDYSASVGNTHLPGDLEPLEMTGEQGDALRGKYIRRLTAVVIHHVPAFWKVSVSVFSGNLQRPVEGSQVSSGSNVNVSAKKTEEKVGDGKYSSHSLDEVTGMLQSTLSAYGSEVQNTFPDLEESNILCPYMSDSMKEISKACHAFEAKESAPSVADQFNGHAEPEEKSSDPLPGNIVDPHRQLLMVTNLFRTAAVNYLLEGGVQWGAAPAVKVFAGCKPLLDKTLDVNGFCQLMLELDYFETMLNPYFTHEARESLKNLQGVLLEKATESVPETIETPSRSWATRGNDDNIVYDHKALAQQYSSELLQSELERTRINTACFVESIPLDSVPDSAKAAYASFRGSMDSPGRGSQNIGPPSYSKQRC
ncbi:hypothetical protein RND71_005098 [Anisodus tanguticus]|uniref:Exocyst complex component SEC5 n=1 Tax=Anisodus tanguticus TaxID=243964 RepID=A0AAE1STH1_9SOLA|nr:hypothetical protein RND71_005098 [Anisodus tanguticus]